MKVFSLILAIFLLIPMVLFAAEGEAEGVVGAIMEKTMFELAEETSYIQYKEPGVMRQYGVMYGLDGSLAYHDNYMVKLESRISWGQVNYRNSGAIDDINDYIMETRLLGGYDFAIQEGTTLTPYLGFGYRYLNDDMSGKASSTGALGYERESNYYYSPIGLTATQELANDWTIGASAEYDIFWWGDQESHLSDAVSGLNDLSNRQNNGYGVRGSFKIMKKTPKFNLLVEPFIRYWNIKKSKEAAVTLDGNALDLNAFEPKNHSTEIGVRVGAAF